MKKITTTLILFITSILLSATGFSQEMPAGNLMVNTFCTLNDGYSFSDAVDAGRAVSYDGEDTPNIVLYRQPISSSDSPANALLRVVYWDNLEHWARSGSTRAPGAGEATLVDATMTCGNTNRTFYKNRNIGEGSAYGNNAENQQSLSAARLCEIKSGNSIADVYTALTALDTGSRPQGDNTLMQISHRMLGGNGDVGMGAAIIIRLVGETSVGLAARLDAGAMITGVPDDAPVQNCQEQTLWSSHVIHWGLPPA